MVLNRLVYLFPGMEIMSSPAMVGCGDKLISSASKVGPFGLYKLYIGFIGWLCCASIGWSGWSHPMFSSLVQAACIGFSEGLLRSVKYLSVPKANVKIQMFLGTSVPCLCSYACALLNGPFASICYTFSWDWPMDRNETPARDSNHGIPCGEKCWFLAWKRLWPNSGAFELGHQFQELTSLFFFWWAKWWYLLWVFPEMVGSHIFAPSKLVQVSLHLWRLRLGRSGRCLETLGWGGERWRWGTHFYIYNINIGIIWYNMCLKCWYVYTIY